MATGKVKFFNAEKGFGFITPADGGEALFVHHSHIEMKGFKNLSEGQKVSYETAPGRKGMEAVEVKPL